MNDLTEKLKELLTELGEWRAERPDEWKMDEFIIKVKEIEKMMPRWIPVSERLPEPNELIIICCAVCDDNDGDFIASGFFDARSQSWQSQDSFKLDMPIPWTVTHWMKLPKGPMG